MKQNMLKIRYENENEPCQLHEYKENTKKGRRFFVSIVVLDRNDREVLYNQISIA